MCTCTFNLHQNAGADTLLGEGRAPVLATVTGDLKTLRISREFFPDLIVCHSCQSNRKICKKCLPIPSPQASHSGSLGHPLSPHCCSCKGTQCNTGWDHCGFFLSHPPSRTSLRFKGRARTALVDLAGSLVRGRPLATVLQDRPCSSHSEALIRGVFGKSWLQTSPLQRGVRLRHHIAGPVGLLGIRLPGLLQGSRPSQMFLLHLPHHPTR